MTRFRKTESQRGQRHRQIYSLVKLCQKAIQRLKFLKYGWKTQEVWIGSAALTETLGSKRQRNTRCVLTALVGPNVQLLGELRDHQESPPALALLGFENVSKDVVTNVDDVLSFDAQQITHNV